MVAKLCSTEGLCSERGKQKAALAAIKVNALESVLELLRQGAISGEYEHPMESALDHLLGNPLTESIWALLLREAVQYDALEIAEAVAIAAPNQLSVNDLQWLGTGMARAGKVEQVREILNALRHARCSYSQLQLDSRQFWINHAVNEIFTAARPHPEVRNMMYQWSHQNH